MPVDTLVLNVSDTPLEMWPGDTAALSAEARDAAGTSLDGEVRWSGSGGAVAVEGDGRVVAEETGEATATAAAASAERTVPVVVYALLSGTVRTVGGDTGEELIAVLRYPDGTADSATIGAAGKFSIRTTRLDPSPGDLVVDEESAPPRRIHPFLLPAPVRDSGPHELVLIPREWTIRNGAHQGETVEVRLNDALFTPAALPSFFGGTHPRGDGNTYVGHPESWLADQLPARVAFNREYSNEEITAQDSAAMWDILDEMERIFGRDLFQPAPFDTSMVSELNNGRVKEPGVITVEVDTTISFGGLGGMWHTGNSSAGEMVWEDSLDAFGESEGGSRSFRYVSERGDAGNVTLREREDLSSDGLIAHEMMHALGAGHGCGWPSSQAKSSAQVDCSDFSRVWPTKEDVAYMELLDAVMELEREFDTHLSLIPGLIGTRVRLLDEAPLPNWPDVSSKATDVIRRPLRP